SGDVLVTTTRRLLDWCRARRSVCCTARADGGGSRIELSTTAKERVDSYALDGLTFYVADPERASLTVAGGAPRALRVNPRDHPGRASVSLPWPRLSFPRVTSE